MRVIAGTARGRRLKGPGERSGRTRPTSDLLRGSMFDALAALGADFAATLDLYAGSGALGIEALSRGAEFCDFVERDSAACAVIRENLRLTGFQDRAHVHRMTVDRALSTIEGPYTLILADPPYADAEALPLLRQIAVSSLVDADTVLVLEHSAREEPDAEIGSLSLINARRHGDSALSIYARR
jgi:16S rRNA (guanine966-N2)-methyltransferase